MEWYNNKLHLSHNYIYVLLSKYKYYIIQNVHLSKPKKCKRRRNAQNGSLSHKGKIHNFMCLHYLLIFNPACSKELNKAVLSINNTWRWYSEFVIHVWLTNMASEPRCYGEHSFPFLMSLVSTRNKITSLFILQQHVQNIS